MTNFPDLQAEEAYTQLLIDKIIPAFRAEFRKTEMWKTMEATTENSPWHREANVALHTDMTVDYYLEHFGNVPQNEVRKFKRSPKEIITTVLSLIFHDVGKPAAQVWRETEERGRHCRFTGHESISARLFEDYAVTHWDTFRNVFSLEPFDLYRITWLIEHHLPFGLKKPQKIEGFARTLVELFRDFGSEDVFYDHLVSDNGGRISDDHDAKKRDVQAWVSEYKQHTAKIWDNPKDADADAPIMYVMIGASGSGKSTTTGLLVDDNCSVYSLDTLRIERAISDGKVAKGDSDKEMYRKAYEHACDKETKFSSWANTEFIAQVKTGENIVLDNTNVSRKSRRFFIDEARKKGYRIIGYVFPVDKATLQSRMATRTDKTIPIESIIRQYNSVSMPNVGHEVDEVVVSSVNLK